MRVLLIAALVAAVTLCHGTRRQRPRWYRFGNSRTSHLLRGSTPSNLLKGADEADARARRMCTTDDGVAGVCRKKARCSADRLALTTTETRCPGGRRRARKICCPRRRGGGGRPRPEANTESPVVSTGGGFNSGGSTTGGFNSGGHSQVGALQGECGRPTPMLVWSRKRRAAPIPETAPETAQKAIPTAGPFIPFIVGGKNAEIGKWPWIVLIGHKQGTKPPFWFCGGTLIDKQNILTAAHCLKPRAVNTDNLVVRLGEYDTTSTNDGASPQDYGVSSFTNHKDFAFPVLHDDISLVHLDKPVEYTDLIKPICLPPGPSGDYAGTRIDVAGWGYTEFGGKSSSILQEVDLPVVAIQECQSKYETSPSFQNQFPGGFGENKLCAAEKEGGKDACQGDSGGPMVRLMDDGRYELIGVVSAGVGCGTPGFPGVYTRVSAYLGWIQQNKK